MGNVSEQVQAAPTEDRVARRRGPAWAAAIAAVGGLVFLLGACGSSGNPPAGGQGTTSSTTTTPSGGQGTTTSTTTSTTLPAVGSGATAAGNIKALCAVYTATLHGHPDPLTFQGTVKQPVVAVDGQTALSGSRVQTVIQNQQTLINAIANDAPAAGVTTLAPVLQAYLALLALIQHDGYNLKTVNHERSLPRLMTPLVQPTAAQQSVLGQLANQCRNGA
jgi:hypothetical protein